MNQLQAQLTSLHAAYNNCLRNKVEEWINLDAAQRTEAYSRGETEFCVTEKKEFLAFMQRNNDAEFRNIMRLEEGNY